MFTILKVFTIILQICSAMFSGCREYKNSGVKVVTGCTSMPAPDSTVIINIIIDKEFTVFFKFCSVHKKENTPCITSERISAKSLNSLRNYRTRSATSKEALQVIIVWSFSKLRTTIEG